MSTFSLRHVKKLLMDIEKFKLSVPEGFYKKSPQWLKRHYNGIGAEWMPKIVRNFTTKVLEKLEPVALIHDIDYLFEPKSYWHFTKANLRFFFNAVKMHRCFIGFTCAFLCQFFGWGAYRDGKESMAYCNYYREN